MAAEARGLPLTRIEALDAASAEAASIDRWFAGSGPLGEIPRGDKCCLLSHRSAWEMFVASGDAHAVFLEDDVRLSPSAAALLTSDNWSSLHRCRWSSWNITAHPASACC